MNIKLGPFLTWWGPYQIADLLQKVGVSEETCYEIGEKMPEWVYTICQKIYDKRKRDVVVHIDKYDTWNMDNTLAHIIVPMLKQLRDTTHGYPADFMDDKSDFTMQLSFDSEGFEWPEETGFDSWKETLDKMIWAFEQVLDDDWEDQYREGELDMQWIPAEDHEGYSEMVKGPNDTYKADYDGMRKHEARMQEGFDLFGKYYRSLWD